MSNDRSGRGDHPADAGRRLSRDRRGHLADAGTPGRRVRDHFATIGVDVVHDDVEGYAYLRSRPVEEGEEALPRLVRRRALTYNVSLLLVLLRKRLMEFETTGAEGRLVLTTDQIVEMLRLFQAESSNDARVVDQAETTIRKAAELGFLRRCAARTTTGRCGGSSRPTSTPRRCRTSRPNCASTPEQRASREAAMSDGLFSAVELGTSPRAGYRLQYAEVRNWGTFDELVGGSPRHRHRAADRRHRLRQVDHRRCVDHLADAGPQSRLQQGRRGRRPSARCAPTSKATTNPNGSQRDHQAFAGQRPAGEPAHLLGDSRVFVNHGYNETVTLAQVFQQRESTGQPYRFYVTATKALSIATEFADFGTDLRDLRKRLRAGGAEIFDEFPKYATSLRRLLGVRSEQALELFHQTVSMKSVGNLNDFVRDHMLEPSDCTVRGYATSSPTSRTSPRPTTR